jgi:hypothetical protein
MDTGWMDGIRFPGWGWGWGWGWSGGYYFLLATLPYDFGGKKILLDAHNFMKLRVFCLIRSL